MNLNHLFSVMNTEALAEKSQPDIKSHSVIIANSTNAQAANDSHPKGEIKPVIPKTVQPSLTAQIERLKKDNSTMDLSHQLAGQVKHDGDIHLAERLTPLGEVKPVIPPQFEENLNSFTPTVETYSRMEDGHLNHKTKVQPTPQIEETPLSLKNRQISPPIGNGQSQTTDELLTRYERPLFHHVLACPYCHIEKAQYCVSGYAMGSVYEALLLNRDDAQARRESLTLRVDRACISGRGVFVTFSRSDDAPPPPNTELQTRKYGNTPEYEAFINHWTACDVCKPNLNRYCSEGVKLKAVADSSYS